MSKVELIRERMRAVQAQNATILAAQPPPPSPTAVVEGEAASPPPLQPLQPARPKKKKEKSPPVAEADPNTVVTHSCKHKTGVRHLQGTPCGYCARNNMRAKRLRRAEAKKTWSEPSEVQGGRLPDGAEFRMTYDASREEWKGMLRIGEAHFWGSASAVFQLLRDLDTQYRNSLSPQN